jgi:hypothetical protein
MKRSILLGLLIAIPLFGIRKAAEEICQHFTKTKVVKKNIPKMDSHFIKMKTNP